MGRMRAWNARSRLPARARIEAHAARAPRYQLRTLPVSTWMKSDFG